MYIALECNSGRTDQNQDAMFSYMSLEDRIPREHPLRPSRTMVDDILNRCLRALPGSMQILVDRRFHRSDCCALCRYIFSTTVRSERLLLEQLDYDLLLCWFVDMDMDVSVWNHGPWLGIREDFLNSGGRRRYGTG